MNKFAAAAKNVLSIAVLACASASAIASTHATTGVLGAGTIGAGVESSSASPAGIYGTGNKHGIYGTGNKHGIYGTGNKHGIRGTGVTAKGIYGTGHH